MPLETETRNIETETTAFETETETVKNWSRDVSVSVSRL